MAKKRTSLEVIAPTVEEAIARGVQELGARRQNVEVEILDAGGKGFFGIAGRQARVRLTVMGRGERPSPQPVQAQAPPFEEPEPELSSEEQESLRASHSTVEELIQRMELDATVNARWGTKDPEARVRPLLVDVRGDDLGILIGRRGETLEAFQYITRLIVAKELKRPVPVVIDIEGYRARRERQLGRLAKSMADQAIELQRTMELEAMPANERRVVHVALRGYPGVYTESVGEGSDRKVTIIPKG